MDDKLEQAKKILAEGDSGRYPIAAQLLVNLIHQLTPNRHTRVWARLCATGNNRADLEQLVVQVHTLRNGR